MGIKRALRANWNGRVRGRTAPCKGACERRGNAHLKQRLDKTNEEVADVLRRRIRPAAARACELDVVDEARYERGGRLAHVAVVENGNGEDVLDALRDSETVRREVLLQVIDVARQHVERVLLLLVVRRVDAQVLVADLRVAMRARCRHGQGKQSGAERSTVQDSNDDSRLREALRRCKAWARLAGSRCPRHKRAHAGHAVQLLVAQGQRCKMHAGMLGWHVRLQVAPQSAPAASSLLVGHSCSDVQGFASQAASGMQRQRGRRQRRCAVRHAHTW